MFGDAISIFARTICSPSLYSPAFILLNKASDSSEGRSRNGEFLPGSLKLPRFAAMSSALWLST